VEALPSPNGEGLGVRSNKIAVEWFDAKFNEQLNLINDLYSKYRMSEALMTTYKLVWDDFCAWYLEMIKPEFVDGKSLPIDKTTYDATIVFFEKILKVMHPFMPFITEEIWSLIKDREEKDCIIVAEWPKENNNLTNSQIVHFFSIDQKLISAIREFRNKKGISPKEKINLFYKGDNKDNRFESIIFKLANLNKIEQTNEVIPSSHSIVIDVEYFIPINNINLDSEKERLTKDLDYNIGFLKSVQIKLSNEKFIANAKPELLANEKKKQADAEAKIKALEEQLAGLK
jgi:valyl-tRNA synthetase